MLLGPSAWRRQHDMHSRLRICPLVRLGWRECLEVPWRRNSPAVTYQGWLTPGHICHVQGLGRQCHHHLALHSSLVRFLCFSLNPGQYLEGVIGSVQYPIQILGEDIAPRESFWCPPSSWGAKGDIHTTPQAIHRSDAQIIDVHSGSFSTLNWHPST